MSVDVEALIIAAGQDPRIFVADPKFLGAVSFTAGQVRALDLRVGYDPDLPKNPYHGGVWPAEGKSAFSRAQARGLVAAAEWYVPMDGVELR